jgi:ATP phosphoribosyltransferase
VASPRAGRVPGGARPAGSRAAAEREDGARLRIAVPVKGRLREPSVSLLEDAGLGPEEPGERALAFPCRNAPVDVLLVRAADIPEYVQDGVVDCGITGQDLVRERGARVEELLELGFGSCRLDVAVPEESRYERVEDLAGASVATVFPRIARELLPVDVELVDVTGSVEIAPRLGLADAIVDLVSSGNTLRTNGLRSLATIFSSQAVLIGRPGAPAGQLVSMMRAVVEARAHRYLMLDAPEASVDEICEVIGSRSPSVIPLAEPGMVAVHALVPATDVWQLLPRLEAVGAFSILVVPVERMLR